MHRWFYANEELVCDLKKVEEPGKSEEEPEPTPTRPQQKHRCRFCVALEDRELLPNEAVAVSGDCDELGNWEFDCCIVMSPVHENNLNIWHVYADIPAERAIAYRYLIVAIDPECDQMIVRFFESHLKTRKVPVEYETDLDVCEDIFGLVNGNQKVERGWLTTERIIQFKFFKAPFKWNSPSLSGGTFNVKVTPFFRKNLYKCLHDAGYSEDSAEQSLYDCTEVKTNQNDNGGGDAVEEKKKTEWPMICGKKIRSFTKLNFDDCEHTMTFSQCIEDCETKRNESTENDGKACKGNIKLSTAFAFNEVANTFDNSECLRHQPRFGIRCKKEDFITVHLTIGDFRNTVYLIELFKYSKNASADEYPYRVGYRYVLPEDFRTYKHGYMEVPIICASKHRPLGCMKFGFTIIHPHPTLKFDLSVSYLRHWNKKRLAMDVGHRGMGPTYYSSEHSMIYENTLYSFNEAIKNGADMVEFDVHLTKDRVPIIYHDFSVHVAKHDNTLLQNFNNINIPLSRYSYDALMNLRILQSNADASKVRIGDAENRLQLFPTVLDALDTLDENIGFDIEVKWPQQLCNRKYEGDVHPVVDRNIYVDRILDVVIQNARKRRIVFTSFDADICTHLRFKQNRYPVMLLIRKQYPSPYNDPRIRTPSIAANFTYTMELLGVVTHADTFKGCPKYIGETLDKNLVVFCYGIENHEEIQDLKKTGVRAVILDRMDEFANIREFLSAAGSDKLN